MLRFQLLQRSSRSLRAKAKASGRPDVMPHIVVLCED